VILRLEKKNSRLRKLLESAEIAHSSHGVGDQCTLIMDYESERRPRDDPDSDNHARGAGLAVADREIAGRPRCQGYSVDESQAVLIAETSNSRVILSLTKTPPVSSAAFQVMP
jgi:hypothetical protein